MAKHGLVFHQEEGKEGLFLRGPHGEKRFLSDDGKTERSFANRDEAIAFCREKFVIGETYPEDDKRIIESGPNTTGYAFTTG